MQLTAEARDRMLKMYSPQVLDLMMRKKHFFSEEKANSMAQKYIDAGFPSVQVEHHRNNNLRVGITQEHWLIVHGPSPRIDTPAVQAPWEE